MLEISMLISALIANLITKYAKPPKPTGIRSIKAGETRKGIVRLINAVAGLLVLITTYTITGGELDVSQVGTYVQVIVGWIGTYATSQGLYFLAKE